MQHSICYDQADCLKRKKFPPESSAQELLADHGLDLLSEDDYRQLQGLGDFDLKTSCWIETPEAIRAKLTGEGGYLVGKFYSGAYGTVGGVKIDENCQVLDDEDQAIPGLYSAGSDANTIYADSYNFTLPGNTMGFAVNSGRIAGLEAAKRIKR